MTRIAPQPATIELIVRDIVRRHPTGRQFEQALRAAAEAGWIARDRFHKPGID